MTTQQDKNLIEKEENGQKISPVLPEHIKNFLIDIDGTIVRTLGMIVMVLPIASFPEFGFIKRVLLKRCEKFAIICCDCKAGLKRPQ